jgi:hypothetical protein
LSGNKSCPETIFNSCQETIIVDRKQKQELLPGKNIIVVKKKYNSVARKDLSGKNSFVRKE